MAGDVTDLAREIAGEQQDVFELAVDIAEAQIDVLRIRRVRSELINRHMLEQPYFDMRDLRVVAKLVRRMVQALEGRRDILPSDIEVAAELQARQDETTPEHQARILTALASRLTKLDRYERRALSRRKFAIRRFDEAMA